MKTNGKTAAVREKQAVKTGRKPRATAVRTRCKGAQTPIEAMEAEVAAAMPQIVRATVKKAKQGSLVHTRWLWGVAEATLMKDGKSAAETSLAAALLAELVDLS